MSRESKLLLVILLGIGLLDSSYSEEPALVGSAPVVGEGIYYDAALYYISSAGGSVWDPEIPAVSAIRCTAASVAFLLFLDMRGTADKAKKQRYAGFELATRRLMKHFDRDRVKTCIENNLKVSDGVYGYLEGVTEEQLARYVEEFLQAFPPMADLEGGEDKSKR